MVAGTAYVHTGRLEPVALWLALSVGALVTNILVANNLRDEEEDRRNGRLTLGTLLGGRALRVGYHGLLALAYAVPAIALWRGWGGPWLLLPWITLPLAWRVSAWVRGGRDRDTLHRTLRASSALHLLFGLLLAGGLLL
jgi:1,4-dihydroxy-2-naphthoate octaprenyltransferase